MKSWQPIKERSLEIKSASKMASVRAPSKGTEPLPEIITRWLARLSLFYGVPFNYLVPDNQMLPLESIRFFHIDQNWILSLLDGACSVGRHTQVDIGDEKEMTTAIHKETWKEIPEVRQRLQQKKNLNDAIGDVWTGFLLRSAIVEGWPGLEARAFKSADDPDSQQPLTILRMERLAKDVLLCIFDGEFQCIEIRQPAESLHFGADEEAPGEYKKVPRGLGVDNLGVPMANLQVTVPFREGAERVVDVNQLVENLSSKLGRQCGKDFTSAEFAIEMVESAQVGVFHNKT